mgnify:CR=1 FL=1
MPDTVEKNMQDRKRKETMASSAGAFERPYFCQERRYEYYEYAQTAEENPAVRHFSRVAAELGIVIPVSFYEKRSIILITALRFWMQMERISAFIGKHIFRMTIIIRKNSISHREIPALRFLIPDLEPLELESAGISGSRKRQDVWHCRRRASLLSHCHRK